MTKQVTKAEIRARCESQSVEHKRSLADLRQACEALCGMVNTDAARGIVLFGIGPDGNVCGVEPGNLDTAQRTLAQHIRDKFAPPLLCDIEVLDCEGAHIVAVEATRSPVVSFHEYDGRAFLREGTSKRLLSFEEKRQVDSRRNRDRHNGPWRCDRCGTYCGMLSIVEATADGPKKSYQCSCGGEFWPATAT